MYIFQNKEIEWEDKTKCPICGGPIREDIRKGCSKKRALVCDACEFTTRGLEIKWK